MSIYLYIALMAAITYLIRVSPLVFLRRKIKNRTLRSFLYYVPYVTLAVMTFPAILEATASPVAALCAFALALVLAWRGVGLFGVTVAACLCVFGIELFL